MKPGTKCLLLKLIGAAALIFLEPISGVAAEEIVKVGVILPLSGSTAEYGAAIQNSILLAQEDRPEAFRRVKFLYEDAQYDNKLAVGAFKKLVYQDKVDLVYVWGVIFCRSISALAEQQHIPMVGLCMDVTSSKGRANVVRFMNSVDDYLTSTIAYARSKGWKRIGIVVTSNGYLEEMLAALERNIDPARESVDVLQRFEAGENDFNSTILRAKRAPYDALGVFLLPGQVGTFYRQAAAQAFRMPTFGTNLFANKSEIALSNGGMEGAVFAENAVRPAYYRRYVERFGNDSQIAFGALAYEFAVTIADLASGYAHKPSGKELLESLSTIAPREGVAAGPYGYLDSEQEGKHVRFPVAVERISGEGFVEATP